MAVQSEANRLLVLGVRISLRTWMFVSCVYCVLCSGFCDELMTRPGDTFLLCV